MGGNWALHQSNLKWFKRIASNIGAIEFDFLKYIPRGYSLSS